ncbi:MAG: outer spore coat protein CotE [Bacilli bacterium]|nr:outer spore coat protein CotE [Bacilli bacterium]MBQ8901887.1 outer spore coat protein CotE [Bacilli bacterium]
MSNYREIVTKAVIGKAKKTSGNKFNVQTEERPDTVLGCWVINNTFNGTNNRGSVLINGAFDVNVWYSYDNDTKTAVSTQRFTYTDKMNVPLKNDTVLDNNSEIIVRSLKQPTVTNVEINNGLVELTIEKELGVEIVGNTKVKISVEDVDDDYEELIDEELDNAIEEINEEYLDTEEI